MLLNTILLSLLLIASPNDRVKLIFSIDQGFGNGIVVNRDAAAMKRIIESLNTLRPKYDVYALFNPQVKDKAGLDAMLDLLVAADLPFVFDVYTSDAITLGTSTAFNQPADGPHGVAISIEALQKYKKRYGRHLAGLRFMEVLSMDFTVRATKTTNPEWNTAGWKNPTDDFFQIEIARRFLTFARDNRMFVQWSDWHWMRFASWDKPLEAQQQAIAKLLLEFPGLVTMTYANNEPAKGSIPRLNNWQEAVEPFLKSGAAGIGLSNQAWLYEPEMSCPIDDMIAWTRRTLEIKSRLIQFEPVWYLFDIPRGSFGREDYTTQPAWNKAGSPREQFRKLSEFLLKAATGRPL